MPDAPFKMPSFDVHFANIIRGYLSSAAAVTAGLPMVDDLPRVAVYDNKAKSFPLLVVAGAAQVQGPRHQRITVAVALHTRLPAKDGENKREEYAQWMQVVHTLLHDHASLYGYIAALPEEQRTGWQLRRVYPGIVAASQLNEKDGTELIPTSIDLDIRLPAQS